jgi:hypothetical protein
MKMERGNRYEQYRMKAKNLAEVSFFIIQIHMIIFE